MVHKAKTLKVGVAIAAVAMILAACSGTGNRGLARSGGAVRAAGSGTANTGEVHRFELVARSDVLQIGDGVSFEGFTFNGTTPGPQLMVNEGDTVEITVVNEDSVTHGLSVHAANTQTSDHVGNIPPGETRTLTFQADYPGVYMYHCAPGGHGIMTHTMGGQFGMMVVEPRQRYRMEEELGREPDVRVYLIQHEVYAHGRDFFDGKALYVMFNGETFRYVREPIQARPGDFVRFYYLNVGPNLTSTFHAVGGIWDHIYYGGNPNNLMHGTQSVVSGPTDSWVIDWIVPDQGAFTLVSHAFGTQAIKGAVGVLDAREDHPRIAEVRSEGRSQAPSQEVRRHVNPFGLGSDNLDVPVRFRPGDRVQIQMVGNSYWPKRAEVPVGTTVTWINEDVFDMLEGERTGKHDVVTIRSVGSERFRSELLAHAETFTFTFHEAGEYEYICSIHPYMRGLITVVEEV